MIRSVVQSGKDSKDLAPDAENETPTSVHFSSSFRPAFKLSKFKIALNTRK